VIVGLIGIGLLGSAIRERLEAEGFTVLCYDINGAGNASSALEVAEQAPTILFSLPTSAVSAQVVHQLEPVLRNGHTIIDTSTGDPEEIEAIGQDLESKGVHYLDATIGGSSQQVRSREAIALVGGFIRSFHTNVRMIESFTKRAFYLGPTGSGARMKLVLNLVLLR
jgi:3-hydroxyisobutyrate dehydrogenase-like beta-hydroxyacid dehydrogenase